MTYYLQDYPAFDRKSSLRIILGLLTMLSSLTTVFRMAFLGIGPIEFVLGVGIPATFVVTFLVMSLVSKIFLPKEKSDFLIELSDATIVIRKGTSTTILKNENLKQCYVNDEEAEFLVMDESGQEVRLPHLVLSDPGHHLRMDKNTRLSLNWEDGKVYLMGNKLLKVRRFPFQ